MWIRATGENVQRTSSTEFQCVSTGYGSPKDGRGRISCSYLYNNLQGFQRRWIKAHRFQGVALDNIPLISKNLGHFRTGCNCRTNTPFAEHRLNKFLMKNTLISHGLKVDFYHENFWFLLRNNKNRIEILPFNSITVYFIQKSTKFKETSRFLLECTSRISDFRR